MNTFEKEMKEADARMDAGAAEYEFYDYCSAGPGAHAATILAGMGHQVHTKAFWDAAMYRAMTAREKFLAWD